MQEQDSLSPPQRTGGMAFAWFALGSLFGAVLLTASLIIASKGAVVDAVFTTPEQEAAKISSIRQAAREGVVEALGDGSIRLSSGSPASVPAPCRLTDQPYLSLAG